MEDLTVQINVENLDVLTELLQKATIQLEQLKRTLEKIEEFKAEIELET